MITKTRQNDKPTINTESICNLCHMAEIGKISSGLFHDLLNPLTSLTISIGHLNNKDKRRYVPMLKEIKESSLRMSEFINLMKNYINHNEKKKFFYVNREINKIIKLMSYKGYTNSVTLIFCQKDNLRILGNPFKFQQIILNLISNAIDSYKDGIFSNKKVIIEAYEYKNKIIINVRDFGCGIREEIKKKIFKPMRSTKKDGHGLGLYNVSTIIKKDFEGKIKFTSELNKGTIFSVEIPIFNHSSI